MRFESGDLKYLSADEIKLLEGFYAEIKALKKFMKCMSNDLGGNKKARQFLTMALGTSLPDEAPCSVNQRQAFAKLLNDWLEEIALNQ